MNHLHHLLGRGPRVLLQQSQLLLSQQLSVGQLSPHTPLPSIEQRERPGEERNVRRQYARQQIDEQRQQASEQSRQEMAEALLQDSPPMNVNGKNLRNDPARHRTGLESLTELPRDPRKGYDADVRAVQRTAVRYECYNSINFASTTPKRADRMGLSVASLRLTRCLLGGVLPCTGVARNPLTPASRR
jgi:hypothetical protein